MYLHTDTTSQDTTVAQHTEGSSPRHQAHLRSHLELDRGLAWDMNVYFVGSLPAQQISSYTRMDTQLTWRIAERLQFSAVGQNLLSDHHAESNDTFTSVNSSQVKRGAYVKLTFQF
jgi:outer membrane receptor protein involved in Fe transport